MLVSRKTPLVTAHFLWKLVAAAANPGKERQDAAGSFGFIGVELEASTASVCKSGTVTTGMCCHKSSKGPKITGTSLPLQ
uniref:Uncharacterized protein n=1 Tax=Sphaerodactylus townsendi TaxID=933632 RepID=A0ACB8ELU6_9SAUR